MKLKFTSFLTSVSILICLNSNAQWTTSGTTIYNTTTTNNVSIGTSSAPGSGIKLNVTGGSVAVNSSPIMLAANDVNHGLGYYYVSPYYTTTGVFANKAIAGPVLFGWEGGALGSSQNSNKNIALRWLHNGRVGVGTNDPEDQFQVGNGLNKFVIGSAYGTNLGGGGTSYIGFNMSRQSGSWSTATDQINNGGATIFSNTQGSLYFSLTPVLNGTTNHTGISDATVVTNTQLFLRSDPNAALNGQVGIGTTNPLARLQINSPVVENALDVIYGGTCNFRVKSSGYVYARDLTVQATTFPDYVFAKDYKLMSLSELKVFIEKNNHLPEMPAAKEVEENGMSISQINTLLVQKVEELTLYILKQQEEIDQLKKQK